MQLILIGKRVASSALLVGFLFFVACNKTESPVRVSPCQLYEHPTAYDGKLIRVAATVTGLENGTYLLPNPNLSESDGNCTQPGIAYIKLDAAQIHNASLTQLVPPTVPDGERKEFDVDVTGTFDSKYSEPWDLFRYRIVAVQIKPLSPVRTGKRLGAA